jgi:hypothetical protein
MPTQRINPPQKLVPGTVYEIPNWSGMRGELAIRLNDSTGVTLKSRMHETAGAAGSTTASPEMALEYTAENVNTDNDTIQASPNLRRFVEVEITGGTGEGETAADVWLDVGFTK